MSNPRTEQAVHDLRQQGWLPLREALEGSQVSAHTFLKSWRPNRVVPRSIEPRVFRGYGLRGRRGSAVALWPPETSRFALTAREVQAHVFVRTRRPLRQQQDEGDPLRRVRPCASLRVALWALGYDYDPELVRDTLIQQLIQFGQLATRRGHQMFRSRGAAASAAPSGSGEEAVEDLIDAHKARLTRAGIRPKVALQELSALLIGQGRSGALMPGLIDDLREATALDLERARTQARTLLLFYVSWEAWRRGKVQMFAEMVRSAPARRRPQLRAQRAEHERLDDAWRHLMHFSVLAGYLVHVAHSTDRRFIQWREHVLPEYGRWTLWADLPQSLMEAAGA